MYKDIISELTIEEKTKDGQSGEIGEEPAEEPRPLTIWQQIVDERNRQQQEMEQFTTDKSKDCNLVWSPVIQYVHDNLFDVLETALERMLVKAIETDSLKYQKSLFNGIDYIAEQLWNQNPLYPERKERDLFVHDMDWVKEYLENNPRPYFPLSWVFTREIAATKIQAFMKGYWVRIRADVQEMRAFWKIMRAETQYND